MLRGFIRNRVLVTLLFGFSVSLLLAIGLIAYRNTHAWMANRDEVIAVRENILDYERLLSALKDSETGQRGYILTGDSVYLRPYMHSVDSLRAISSRLQNNPGKDLLTVQTEARINDLIGRRLSILDNTLRKYNDLRRTSPATASNALYFGQGRQLMDNLRLEIKQLQSYHLQLLSLRTRDLDVSSRRVVRAQIGFAVAGILLLLWAFILLTQEMKKRQQALKELEQANNTLEMRVQERTSELQAALEELNASNEELNASNEELFAGNEQQALLLEKLNSTQDRLNLAFRISGMGAWKWDLQTDVLEWDSNLESVYGLGPGDFRQKYGSNLAGLQKLIHPDDLPGLMAVAGESIKTQKPFKTEYRIITPGGQVRWLLGQGTVMQDGRGNATAMAGIDIEITGRKKAEKKIRESEERFRTMADEAPVMIWMSDTDAMFIYFNRPWLEFTGRTLEQESGNGWTEGIHPDDFDRCLQTCQSAFAARKSFRMEYRLRRHDGSWCWMLDHGVPRFLPDGTFEGFIGSCINIHDRVEAEAKLKRLFNSGMLGVTEWSLEGGIYSANDTFLKMIGYSREEMNRKEIDWASLTPAEYGSSDELAARQMKETGAGVPYEKELTRKDGSRIWVTVGAATLDQKLDTGIAFVLDVTDRQRALQRLSQNEERFRVAIGNSPILVFNCDCDLRYSWVYNNAATSPAEDQWLVGKTDLQVMQVPAEAERVMALKREVIQSGKGRREEVQMTIEGQPHNYILTIEPLRNETGSITGLTCATIDITERKEVEERVKKSERLLYEVFENSADALFLINVNGSILERYNQQAVLLFELEDNQKYVGLQAQNLQKHPFTEAETAGIMEQLTTQGYWSAELEYVSVKGREFWGNAAVSYISVNDQQYFLIRIRDITERKHFEQKLQKSQQVMEAMFEGVADALFLVDPHNNEIVNCNNQVVKLFEFDSKEEVMGLKGNELQKTPFTKEESTRIRREIWTRRYWSAEVEYVSRKGREFWGDIAITVVPFEDKEYLLVRVGDITDRKQYQEILRQNQLELLRQKQRTEEVLTIIAEDNERKTLELEEARTLQLSMLPQEKPSLPFLDFAVIMKTSAEVGGDYYDYKLHANGDITLVIGDATGHGLKAGIVVATVKSYFQTLAGQYEAVELLTKISEGIQNLQIRGMYMGLTVMHFSRERLLIASSGMPPLYLFRQATGQVETIMLKGLFLGSRLEMPIQQQIIRLQPGDTLLAMTDGLPELFDEQRRMLDYDRIETEFRQTASGPAQEIIDHLLDLSRQWNDGMPNEDDITLLAVKIKVESPETAAANGLNHQRGGGKFPKPLR